MRPAPRNNQSTDADSHTGSKHARLLNVRCFELHTTPYCFVLISSATQDVRGFYDIACGFGRHPGAATQLSHAIERAQQAPVLTADDEWDCNLTSLDRHP